MHWGSSSENLRTIVEGATLVAAQMSRPLGLPPHRHRRGHRATGVGIVLLGLLAGAVQARAQPLNGAEPIAATFEWEAPPGCPDRDAMQAMIDATIGDVEDDDRRSVDVRGQLRVDDDGGFELLLELDGGAGGVRQLRGASCEELSEAAALVVAMAIDPRLFERLESTTESTEEPTLPTVPEDPEDPEPSPPIDDRIEEDPRPEPSTEEPTPILRRAAALFRVEGGVGGSPVPGASGVLGLMLGLGGRRWRAELGASYWTPRSTISPANAEVGVRAQLWAVTAQGCAEPRRQRLSFPLCAGLLAGAVMARGEGILEGRAVTSRWLAAAVEPGLVVWLHPRWGLGVRARGHVAMIRPELRSEPSGTIFAGSPVGGSLRLGVEARLP